MRQAFLAWMFVGWAAAASAGTSDTIKTMSRRAEADQLAAAVIQGGNVNQIVNRAHFLGEEATVAATLAAALPKAPSIERRRDIAQALAALQQKDSEPALLDGLEDADAAVRMWCAKGLGQTRSVVAGPRLVPMLADATAGVRKEAARALGALRVARYGQALFRAAGAEGDPEVRTVMLIASGMSGDRRLAAKLEAYLTHSSDSARFGAAQALVLLGSAKGFAFARERLASSDRFERQQGLALFEGLRAKDAAVVLGPLLNDEDRRLAAQAARILVEGGDRSKLEWLVLQSFQATGEDRLAYEDALERLRLTDEQRAAILRQRGLLK